MCNQITPGTFFRPPIIDSGYVRIKTLLHRNELPCKKLKKALEDPNSPIRSEFPGLHLGQNEHEPDFPDIFGPPEYADFLPKIHRLLFDVVTESVA